ncbi:MAG TPA: hypothetical protein VGR00_14520, partial [Thermoanaerobaculia bacterium]|nr:hypothetical protein [Thermoanaerobaculia bacterium]
VGATMVFGSILPGASPGTLSTGNLTFAAQGDYFVELNGPTPGSCGACYDQLAVSGIVDLGGSTLHVAYNGFGATPGQTFTIVSNDGSEAVVGTFGGLPNLAYLTSNGAEFQITYSGIFSNDVVLTAVAPPFASISPGSMSGCGAVNQLLTATPAGGNGDYTSYQWYRNGGAIGGATSSTYNATQSGSYTVTVTDSLGVTGPQSAATALGDTTAPTISAPPGATVTQTTCQ